MVVGKLKDLTQTPHFGYLTVIERAENIGRYVAWKCKCKCGKELVVWAKDLTSGNTKSCGCIKSHGEQQIAEILTENNVEFAREYTFKDFVLENGGRPRFDFAIFNEGKLSHLIEYDGIQHFEYTDSGWNT